MKSVLLLVALASVGATACKAAPPEEAGPNCVSTSYGSCSSGTYGQDADVGDAGHSGARADAGDAHAESSPGSLDAGPSADGSTEPLPETEPDAGADPIDPSDPYSAMRQLCADTINMYRASRGLVPLVRASAEVEACSDQGAEYDSQRYPQQVHGSASASALACRGADIAQNSCPNYPYGGAFGGTIAQALTTCLKQMWDEGEPPEGVEKCTNDYFAGKPACFLAHGHYINMISDHPAVSCGFYDTGKQEIYMNQDFPARRGW